MYYSCISCFLVAGVKRLSVEKIKIFKFEKSFRTNNFFTRFNKVWRFGHQIIIIFVLILNET